MEFNGNKVEIKINILGFHYGDEDIKPSTFHYCVEQCIDTYRAGLQQVYPEKKEALWNYYLDYLLDLKQHVHFKEFAIQKLLMTFAEAARSIQLKDHYYLQWIKLIKNDDAAISLLENGKL